MHAASIKSYFVHRPSVCYGGGSCSKRGQGWSRDILKRSGMVGGEENAGCAGRAGDGAEGDVVVVGGNATHSPVPVSV